MNKLDRFLVIEFIVLVLLLLYFASWTMMDGGKNLRMNENGWTGRNMLEWFPEVFTLGFVALIGWLLFEKKSKIMKKKSNNRFILFNLIIFSFVVIFLAKPMYPQSPVRDTTIHPYHVNYWVTGGVLTAGLVAEKIGVPWISSKSPITSAELQALDRNNFTAIDRWALDLDPSNMDYYVNLSDNVLTGIVLLPALNNAG